MGKKLIVVEVNLQELKEKGVSILDVDAIVGEQFEGKRIKATTYNPALVKIDDLSVAAGVLVDLVDDKKGGGNTPVEEDKK